MGRPPIWTIDQLRGIGVDSAAVWATPSVRPRTAEIVRCPVLEHISPIAPGLRTLIVIGGGTFLDEAKYLRKTQNPHLRLIALPSIWGSGAECSPVAVLNRNGIKEIHMDPAFLPDAIVYWPELLKSIPESRAFYACGDAWAHVLEAFFSPLATPGLRAQAASLIQRMHTLPLAKDAGWFEASGDASSIQAACSVGLVHGIAHTIEMALAAEHPGDRWSHARLCSVFLFPVMSLNDDVSPKFRSLCREYNLDFDSLLGVTQRLFEPEPYRQALPMLAKLWPVILKDRCTRTNGALVRSKHLAHFEKFT